MGVRKTQNGKPCLDIIGRHSRRDAAFFSPCVGNLHAQNLRVESERNIFEQDSGPWSGGHAPTIV